MFLMRSGGPGSGNAEPSRNKTIIEEKYDLQNKLPSTAVVEAIASAEDVGTTELAPFADITLYDCFDPDALNRLLTSSDSADISVTFSVDEYIVWIEKGRIAVARPVNASPDSD